MYRFRANQQLLLSTFAQKMQLKTTAYYVYFANKIWKRMIFSEK